MKKNFIHFSLIICLSIGVNICYAQNTKLEKLYFNGSIYQILVLEKNNEDFLKEAEKKIIEKIITPIEKSSSSFEVRQFNLNDWKGNKSIKVFKIEDGVGYFEFYSYKFSTYRVKDVYPDSIFIDEHNQILLRKINSWKLNDTITNNILKEFLGLYVLSMKDQSDFIENLTKEGNQFNSPCKNLSDCGDFLMPYEIKVNGSVRRFSRVGLDYYKFNKQMISLKENPMLSNIFDENMDKLFNATKSSDAK